MRNRLHFIPVFIIAVVALILGSFLDLSMSKGMFLGATNGFTITFGILGVVPLCGGIIFLATIMLTRHKIVTHKFWRFIVIFVAICAILFGLYYFADNVLSVNVLGSVIPDLLSKTSAKVIGFILSDLCLLALTVPAGILLRNKVDDEKFLRSAAGIIVIAGVGCVLFFIVKVCMPRLRYREMIQLVNGDSSFTNWWQPLSRSDYNFFINLGVNKEELRSFPSGHTLCSCYTVLFIPFVLNMFKKSNKTVVISFYCSFLFVVVCGLSRICGGAHYLSDTAFGTILMLCLLLIYNEYEMYIRFPKVKETIEKN